MYSLSIETLIQRLSDLLQARRKLDVAIERTQTRVRTEAILRHQQRPHCRETALKLEKPIGFTDAVRSVLATYNIWLTPTAVRDLLPSVGFEANSSRNLLTSTHTVLKRLVKNKTAACRRSGIEVLYRHFDHIDPGDDPFHSNRFSRRNRIVNKASAANMHEGATPQSWIE